MEFKASGEHDGLMPVHIYELRMKHMKVKDHV